MARSFPIRYDSTAVFLVLLASSELVFAALFPTVQAISIFAITMMLVGLVDYWLANKGQLIEAPTTLTRTKNVVAFTAAAISVFFALNAFVPAVPTYARQVLQDLPQSTIGLQTQIAFSQQFLLLIAVAEESFFRGLWANVFISKLGIIVGAGLQATFFTAYHIVSYGDALFVVINGNSYPSPAAFILWGGGLTLAYIDVRTGTVATSMIGHILNNSFSGGLIPLPHLATAGMLSPALMVGTVGFTLMVAAVQLSVRRWRGAGSPAFMPKLARRALGFG